MSDCEILGYILLVYIRLTVFNKYQIIIMSCSLHFSCTECSESVHMHNLMPFDIRIIYFTLKRLISTLLSLHKCNNSKVVLRVKTSNTFRDINMKASIRMQAFILHGFLTSKDVNTNLNWFSLQFSSRSYFLCILQTLQSWRHDNRWKCCLKSHIYSYWL